MTLWFVLRGLADTPVTGDPNELHGVRWVNLDHVDDWVDTCYAPPQVSRFMAKMAQHLDPEMAAV